MRKTLTLLALLCAMLLPTKAAASGRISVPSFLSQIPAGIIIGEGVENTTVGEKATKRIANGQLVIEKNGVRYNAQGAVVR